MSDALKDAMGRAVDRLAPFPPSAEALKQSAKRSQLRRRLVGGWIGFWILGTLSGWLFFGDGIGDGDNPRPPDRRSVAAPVAWNDPEIAARIDLPGKPMSISSDGTDVWVGLLNGNLVRIDPATNEVVQEIDVGGGITEIAVDGGTIWAAGTPEGTEPSAGFGGYHVEDIFKVDAATGEVSAAIKLRAPSNVRMAAGDGKVFYLDNTNGSNTGQVFGYDDATGETTDYKWSASSLAVSGETLWLGGDDAVITVDTSTGEAGATQSWGSGGNVGTQEFHTTNGACMDCPPPPRALAVTDDYIAHASMLTDELDVLERSGNLLSEVRIDDSPFGGSLAIDGDTLFVRLDDGRVGVFDLPSGDRSHVVDGVGPYVGQMTVAAQSLWVEDEKNGQIVRISDSEPEPVASDEPTSDDHVTYKDEELGFSVTYPSDWYRAEEKMTDIATPRELFTIGSFPLLPGGSCMPTKALADVQPNGALVYAFEDEKGDPDFFKKMPAKLGLDDLEPPGGVECGGEQDVMRGSFTDSGRNILLFVALGKDATAETKRQASDVLDSLHFDPAPAPAESGEPEDEMKTYRDDENDFSLQYPKDWYVKTGVTDMTNPSELLVLSTVPIEPGGLCAPERVLKDLGPEDAVMMLIERDHDLSMDYPPGSDRHFRDFYEKALSCWSQTTEWYAFRSEGRHLIMQIAPSELVPVFRKEEIGAIVNSLEFD